MSPCKTHHVSLNLSANNALKQPSQSYKLIFKEVLLLLRWWTNIFSSIFLCCDNCYIQPKNSVWLPIEISISIRPLLYWYAHEWVHKYLCKLWDNQKLISNQELWDLWQYPRAPTLCVLPMLSIYHWLKFWLLKLIQQASLAAWQSYRSHFHSNGWFTRPTVIDYKLLFSNS